MKFGQLIKLLPSAVKSLRLKCTQIDFNWGSASDPVRGAYSAPQIP